MRNYENPNDLITYLCIDYLESKGYKFLENKGYTISVEKDGDKNFYWTSDSPFKIFHPVEHKTQNYFKEISKLKEFKKLWGEKCDEDLNEIFQEEDIESYQIKTNTQNLKNFKNEVSNFLEEYKFLKISSPMATRKSIIIEETLKQSLRKKLRVLFITPRVSLSYDIHKKYFPHLSHYKNNNYTLGDNLVVQFDSLYKFDMDYFDVVILDEVTSLILYMSDTYEGKSERYRKNLQKFYSLKNKKFLLSDAFLLKFPLEFEGDKSLGIINEFREDIKITEYINKNNFTGKIIREAKKHPVSVSSNEKRFLVKIKEKLEKRGLRCLMLNSETTNKDRVYEEFAKKETDYDVILYSPTLTVGVSIFSNIKNHFHYDLSGTIDVISSIQMIRRVRNAKHIHYYIQGRRSFLPTEEKIIQRHLEDSFKIINEFGESFGINKIGEMLSKIKRVKNILLNSHKYAFRDLLKRQFKEVEFNRLEI